MKLSLSESIYRPKFPHLLEELGEREIAKNKIEIIPIKKEEFDFISFVDFAKTIDGKYFADPMVKKKDKSSHIKVYQLVFVDIPKSKYKYSFHITFGENFMPIRVFLKYYMNKFLYIYEEGRKKYIDILNEEPFSVNQDQYDFTPHEKHFRKNSLLSQVATYFTTYLRPCPDCVISYFHKILNIHIKESLVFPQQQRISNVSDLLDYCPGHIKVSYQKIEDHVEVRYLSIIFPWAFDVLAVAHYLELVASFYTMNPYTFCLSQAIYFNESIPLSITLSPTESTVLYEMIFDHFDELSENKIKWNEQLVLSDMGSAIQLVCKSNKIKQFFCHRHILQHFGSSSVLAIFCNRLLHCFSFHEYSQVVFEIEKELDEYIAEKIKIGNITSDFDLKVDDLRVMLNGYEGDPNSNYYIENWALWVRRDYHNMFKPY